MSRWEGDCPKCEASFDRDTEPLPGGTMCPACKDAGRTLVGVIQWSKCAPDPRDARLAALEAEVATVTKAWEEAELLIDRWRDFVTRERDKYDFRGKGGQQCGDMSPKINLSALIEMERDLRQHPGNARYTMEEFLKLRAEVARLEALIVAWWEKQGGAPVDALCGEALRVIRSRR